MAVEERRDLFGRTEAELVVAIEGGKILLETQSAWRGNDTLGAEVKSARLKIEVDIRCLARLRGEKVVEPIGWRPDLAGAALAKWRQDICSMGFYSQRRES